jgi:hypothetical protein
MILAAPCLSQEKVLENEIPVAHRKRTTTGQACHLARSEIRPRLSLYDMIKRAAVRADEMNR